MGLRQCSSNVIITALNLREHVNCFNLIGALLAWCTGWGEYELSACRGGGGRYYELDQIDCRSCSKIFTEFSKVIHCKFLLNFKSKYSSLCRKFCCSNTRKYAPAPHKSAVPGCGSFPLLPAHPPSLKDVLH